MHKKRCGYIYCCFTVLLTAGCVYIQSDGNSFNNTRRKPYVLNEFKDKLKKHLADSKCYPVPGRSNTYECPGVCLQINDEVTLGFPGYSVEAWPIDCQSGERTGDVFVYGDRFNQGLREYTK